MRLTENIEMLEVKGEHGVIYPVLAWDSKEVVLIDTGFPGQDEPLKESIESAGFSLEQITMVIITHQDLDHIGNAKMLSGLGAQILAHEEEAPYIQGDVTSVRLSDMEERMSELTDGEKAFYEQAKKGAPMFYTHVDRKLKDNEIVDVCGGIMVIHTPGHMPGHIMLLFEQSKIIVAGDGANIADGKLIGANPVHTKEANRAQAQESFEKMLSFNPVSVVCYHGGCLQGLCLRKT